MQFMENAGPFQPAHMRTLTRAFIFRLQIFFHVLQSDQESSLHVLLEEENSKILNRASSVFDQTIVLGELWLVHFYVRKQMFYFRVFNHLCQMDSYNSTF